MSGGNCLSLVIIATHTPALLSPSPLSSLLFVPISQSILKMGKSIRNKKNKYWRAVKREKLRPYFDKKIEETYLRVMKTVAAQEVEKDLSKVLLPPEIRTEKSISNSKRVHAKPMKIEQPKVEITIEEESKPTIGEDQQMEEEEEKEKEQQRVKKVPLQRLKKNITKRKK